MRPAPLHSLQLINTPQLDAIPAQLLRARRSADARLLANADWLLRRKADGRFLAALDQRGAQARLHPLESVSISDAYELPIVLARLGWQAPSSAAIARPFSLRRARPAAVTHASALPLDAVRAGLQRLGVDTDYGQRHALELVAEPAALRYAGCDRYNRPLWLHRDTAEAWMRMREVARLNGIVIEAISGFRSHAYQLGIFHRKLARGQTIEQILHVNAAPGYSEHHGGCALDIGAPGEAAAEESFESTPAFAWLQQYAAGFGFHLSYPRENPHGITYEPWHWCWHADGCAG